MLQSLGEKASKHGFGREVSMNSAKRNALEGLLGRRFTSFYIYLVRVGLESCETVCILLAPSAYTMP